MLPGFVKVSPSNVKVIPGFVNTTPDNAETPPPCNSKAPVALRESASPLPPFRPRLLSPILRLITSLQLVVLIQQLIAFNYIMAAKQCNFESQSNTIEDEIQNYYSTAHYAY
jgi:hypothetical protein